MRKPSLKEFRLRKWTPGKHTPPSYPIFHVSLQWPPTLATYHDRTGVWPAINRTKPTSTLTLLTTRSMMRVVHFIMFMRVLGISINKRFKHQMALSTALTLV